MSYKVNNKEYSFDSLKNQSIKDKFINREIYTCISDMADHLFTYNSDGYASWDEWDNLYMPMCPECGYFSQESNFEETDDCDGYICPYCGETLDEIPDSEPQEIYEYWLISNWFGEKLRDLGEPVFERWGAWIWGRCCTGQAISLDGVIGRVCESLEILEGQKYEWNV